MFCVRSCSHFICGPYLTVPGSTCCPSQVHIRRALHQEAHFPGQPGVAAAGAYQVRFPIRRQFSPACDSIGSVPLSLLGLKYTTIPTRYEALKPLNVTRM